MLINMESVFNEKERNRTTSRGLCLYCSLSMRNFQCWIQKKYSRVFIYNFERGIYLLDLITTVAFQKSFAILWKKKTWVHSEVAHTQLTFTCSKSTIITLEKGVKFVQSYQWKHQNDVIDVVLLFLLLTLNIFHIFLFLLLTFNK